MFSHHSYVTRFPPFWQSLVPNPRTSIASITRLNMEFVCPSGFWRARSCRNTLLLHDFIRASCSTTHYEASRRTRYISDTKANRDTAETIAEILELCKQSTSIAHIIHKTPLPHSATLKFLKHLQKTELLKLNHQTEKYETTEKGLEYLKKYSGLART